MNDKVSNSLTIEIQICSKFADVQDMTGDPAEAEVFTFLYALRDIINDAGTNKLQESFGLRELHSNLMPGRWLEDFVPVNADEADAHANSRTLEKARVNQRPKISWNLATRRS